MMEVHSGALKPRPSPPALGTLPPCYEKPMPNGDVTERGTKAHQLEPQKTAALGIVMYPAELSQPRET